MIKYVSSYDWHTVVQTIPELMFLNLIRHQTIPISIHKIEDCPNELEDNKNNPHVKVHPFGAKNEIHYHTKTG
jgi:hypothetical protein